jgi:prophage regulatory protein
MKKPKRGKPVDKPPKPPEPPELVAFKELLGFANLRTIGVPYSRQHIWRLIGAGNFPKPIKFGAGANCRCLFPKSEIQKWIEERKAERDAAA